jgi:uroporphyrinogen decarboxylase
MMTKREVIQALIRGERPPYVPWSFGFTVEANEKLKEHYHQPDLEGIFDNHLLSVGNQRDFFKDVGNDCLQDAFGVVWDRSIDKDIGVVKGCCLPQPTLKGYTFPDPLNPLRFADIPGSLAAYGDRYRLFNIGFTLYERAWTLRGMINLMMDFHDNPGFAHDLLNAIADYNIAQVHEAVKYANSAAYRWAPGCGANSFTRCSSARTRRLSLTARRSSSTPAGMWTSCSMTCWASGWIVSTPSSRK